MCKYVGEYTEENLRVALDMNKDRIDDIDFVQPGTVIRLPDNRRPKLATPEAEWWDGRGMGAAAGKPPRAPREPPSRESRRRRSRPGERREQFVERAAAPR